MILIPAAVYCLFFMPCAACDSIDDLEKFPDIPDPQLGYSVPDRNSYGISTNHKITVAFYFNQPVEGDTINRNSFTVKKDGGENIDGSVEYNSASNSASFTPASILAPGTYTATLDGGIKYSTGENIESGYSWSFTTAPRYWTVMVYLDGDNNIESYMMDDINEMMSGYNDLQGLDLILLVDRIGGYSTDDYTLGEDFTDTRLYRITRNYYTRLDGTPEFKGISRSTNYEANMGDAETLKNFIDFCKTNYPAGRYALILWNHGDGVRGRGGDITGGAGVPNKAICLDDTDGGDAIYTAEITDVLTSAQSVDLLGFDACLMGSAEIAYQYRPSNGDFQASYMTASPANESSAGWDYYNILSRIKTGGGASGETDSMVGGGVSKEAYYDPKKMSAKNLCGLVVEEQYDSAGKTMRDQTLSCYDLSKAQAVKAAVDILAAGLSPYKDRIESIRGSGEKPGVMHYFNHSNTNEWIFIPFFDLYDLCERIKNDNTGTFTSSITDDGVYAENVMHAVDDMILYSFAGSEYNFYAYHSRFSSGKNGLRIFFPDGDDPLGGVRHWAYQWWYNSIDTNAWRPPAGNEEHLYGKLSWCKFDKDGNPTNGIGKIGVVENWFEMLDKWFDTTPSGTGLNGYRY